MFPFITELIDKTVIAAVCARQAKTPQHVPHLEEARALLGRPDFFPSEIAVPELKWDSKTHFHFSSSITSPWSENNTVYGKLFRCGQDWQSKPTIVLIHGWNDEVGYSWRHPYLAGKLLRRELNVAMLELPFHMRRRPRTRGAVKDILSEDLLSNMTATRQGFADIRALLAWLDAQGCSRLGLWGISLGGWFSGLVSCNDVRVKLTILTVPASRMDEVIAERDFCAPVRRSLAGEHLPFEKLNLRSHRPKMFLHNILIVEAEQDLFVSKSSVEEVWEAWGKPEIWRLRHAHITGIFSPSTMHRTIGWIAEKAHKIT